MFVRDSCSKQLDSDRLAADVPEELITERGLYREGRGFRVERGEGLRAKATERQVGEQLGEIERGRLGRQGERRGRERKGSQQSGR